MHNFADAIRNGVALNAPIEDANISTLLCHYGNIALETSGTLEIDTSTRKILNNPAAMELWKREYAPGWEPKV